MPVISGNIFAAGKSFAGVETRGGGVGGNDGAEERVGDVGVDGMLVSVDVDLKCICVNDRAYWADL
jgi:hypothetical protein